MSAEDVEEWLRQAAGYRDGHIKSVIITGGEPFYNLDLLRQVLDSALDKGLVPAVVTNAFWAKDPGRATALLESLPQIKMLSVSSDVYHQKAIPFQNVENAILAARKLGVRHNVALCFGEEDDPAYLALKRRVEETVDPDLIRVAAVYPAGRAVRQFGRDGDGTVEQPPPAACTAADFPTIFPDASMIGCMGIVKELPRDHPLYFGSLRQRTLAQILDESEANVALHILRLWGPARLVELLTAAGCGERLPKRFRKHAYCDLCYALASDGEMRRALKTVTAGKELAQKTAYARLYYLKEGAMIDRLEEPDAPARHIAGEAAGDKEATEKETEPGFLENLGFLITYRCQVACPHCIVGAGPHRTEEMATEDIFAWLDQAAAYRNGRIRTACFTGGEPFYDVEKLGRICLQAVSRGIVPTAVTNAFWAETPRKAVETLEKLPALRVISVSTDAHHLAKIPFDRVENALNAARELGLNYNVAVCTEDVNDPRHMGLMERLERIVSRSRISTVITFPVGRAAGFVNIARYAMTDELPKGACPSAHTPVVFPDGRVSACIGPVIDLHVRHPLLLGNLREQALARILDAAEMNVALHIIRVWGPAKLYEMLDERGFGGRLPRRFVKDSICNLCYSIMSDEGLREAVADLERDSRLAQKTAYARQYYLSETTMVEAMDCAGLLDHCFEPPAGRAAREGTT
jgi:MoaA/NifB/PqqE/SkfB family radical SAM enzyme